MKNKPKKPHKSVSKAQHKLDVARYRRQQARRVDLDEWHACTRQLSDNQLSELLRVSLATAGRWRRGESRVPWMAMELVKQSLGMKLPAAFRDFTDFLLMNGNDGAVLVPPGGHWKDGVRAADVCNWYAYRRIIARSLSPSAPGNVVSAKRHQHAGNAVENWRCIRQQGDTQPAANQPAYDVPGVLFSNIEPH